MAPPKSSKGFKNSKGSKSAKGSEVRGSQQGKARLKTKGSFARKNGVSKNKSTKIKDLEMQASLDASVHNILLEESTKKEKSKQDKLAKEEALKEKRNMQKNVNNELALQLEAMHSFAI